jgi:hypothetical protein
MNRSTTKLLIYLTLDVLAVSIHLFFFQYLFLYFLIFLVVTFLPIQIYSFILDRRYEEQVKRHQLQLQEMEQIKKQPIPKLFQDL